MLFCLNIALAQLLHFRVHKSYVVLPIFIEPE